MNNECCVEWCKGVQCTSGRGYCRRHYDQMRKYGRILDVRNRCDLNRIKVFEDHAEIVITDNKDKVICITSIDVEDVEKVKKFRWTSNGKYVRRFEGTKPIYLHRTILSYYGPLDVDHINGDKLDNRKINLRIVTHAENLWNTEHKNYRKVEDRNLKKPYYVRVTRNNKAVVSAYVETEEEAKRLSTAKRKEHGLIR